MKAVRCLLFVVAMSWIGAIGGSADASSFNEVTAARLTFEGTATNLVTGEVRTGVLGSGRFAYEAVNLEKNYELSFFDPVLSITASQDFRRVTEFQADLFGKSFEDSFFGGGGGQFSSSVDYLWKLPLNAGDQFPGGGMGPSMVVLNSSGGPNGSYQQVDNWRMGVSDRTVDTLMMDPDGRWSYVNSGGAGEPISASGTWTATPEAVPEPLTIAATGLAISLGFVFRKLTKKN